MPRAPEKEWDHSKEGTQWPVLSCVYQVLRKYLGLHAHRQPSPACGGILPGMAECAETLAGVEGAGAAQATTGSGAVNKFECHIGSESRE